MPKTKLPDHDPLTGEIHEKPLGDGTGDQPYLRSYGMRPERLDDHGREVLDPTPIAPPIGWKPEPSMVEIIRAQIAGERLRQEAEAAGKESFEEADDFDVDDDFDPSSPYEEIFDPAPAAPRFRTAQEEIDPERPHHKERQSFKDDPETFLKSRQRKPAKPADADPPSDGPRTPEKKTPAGDAPKAD